MPELDLVDELASEGGLLERRHLVRERNPQLRRRKITAVLRAGQAIRGEVCSFEFGRTYGKRGHEYTECHRLPLHVSSPVRTKLDDLALLCSNCHRMIHRGKPWLTIEQLRSRLQDVRSV